MARRRTSPRLFLLIGILAGLGARELAVNRTRPALEMLERAERALGTGETARLRAEALWKLGRLKEAEKAARQAVAREPIAAAHRILGRILAAGSDPGGQLAGGGGAARPV